MSSPAAGRLLNGAALRRAPGESGMLLPVPAPKVNRITISRKYRMICIVAGTSVLDKNLNSISFTNETNIQIYEKIINKND